MKAWHGMAAAALASLGLMSTASAAQAAAFPVNPGPMVAGRTIIGTGQNLPPIAGETYNVGSYMAPVIEEYYTGKAIQRDRADVALAAWRFVRDWTRTRCGDTSAAVKACGAAVVFDVDETLLNSYSYSLSTRPQFTFDPTTWTEYVDECGYAGIPQTRDLFQRFTKLGVHVSLVSAGSRDTKQAMVSCLHKNGISGWDRYIMKGSAADNLTDAQYKATARAALERSGLTIIASIGDQVSDMSYGYLRRGFLMPNTMYYLS
ncbi:MAG: HAD family acid phosphatase [Candidatus Nanopelagicales bacterium]